MNIFMVMDMGINMGDAINGQGIIIPPQIEIEINSKLNNKKKKIKIKTVGKPKNPRGVGT